jgi:hypothetical protein
MDAAVVAAVVPEKTLKDQPGWRDFNPGSWCTTIDVRDFIVRNVTLYEGDESFLVQASPRTKSEPTNWSLPPLVGYNLVPETFSCIQLPRTERKYA